MHQQMHTLDHHIFPQTAKNHSAKKSLLLPKIIFSPRNTNEVAQILRTSPDASTKRDAIQKLYPFEMSKPKALSQDNKGKRTIFSQVNKAKKPAFFSKKPLDIELAFKHHKYKNDSKTLGVEESITNTLSSEMIERSKYDLNVDDDPLETTERQLEVKGINTSKSGTPTHKGKATYNIDEKKKSKDKIHENVFERVLSQKNKPPQEDFNDLRLVSTNSLASVSGHNFIPYTTREPNMNQFQNKTLPSKPHKLMIDTMEDRPDIDKLPPFEYNAHAFAKYSHLLNLSNPQQVSKILIDRARTMKAASLARNTIDASPMLNSPSNPNYLDRQSIQKSLQRNQVKSYVSHQAYDRRTSENEIIKVVSKLDSHKIALPSSRGKPEVVHSEPKPLPPVIVPSLSTTDAAEENLMISFKYVPVVKYATKNKFSSISKRNGISPRRRLQLELERKEYLMSQLEKMTRNNAKSRSPARDVITLNSIQDTAEEEEDELQASLSNQEEMFKRAQAMQENDTTHYIDKIADDIVMSAKYKL